MKKRVFLLGNPDGIYVRQLLQTAPTWLEVAPLRYEELMTSLASPGDHSGFAKYPVYAEDVVLVRSMGKGSLESVVFRMDCLAAMEMQGTQVLNPAKALEAAIDKYLALFRLGNAGLPVPPTHVSQTLEQAMAGWAILGEDVVVKPIFGSEGRGLIRVADEDHAYRVFKSLVDLQSVIYQQKFLGRECRDLRVLIIADDHWSMERQAEDWRKNLARGGRPVAFQASSELVQMARQAMEVLGLTMAGVDFLETPGGQTYLIEVNGVPGWNGIEELYSVSIAQKVWSLLER